MNVILETHSLTYEYDGNIPALSGADFLVRENESLALIGANGAGKSTLLQLLVGILTPKSGEIHFAGNPVTKKNLPHVREKIGFVFQSADHQLFCGTVLEDVMFGPLNAGLSPAEAASRAEDCLASLGISHLSGRAPYRLSAGEKRLCAIACALSTRPDVLLMDEPTSELDPRARRELIALLGRLPQAKIIATHDLDFAAKTCTRAMILHGGKIAADGACESLLTNDELLARLGL